MAMSIRGNLNIFQQSIQYKYRDTALLKRALTHSSYANEHHMDRHDNNERLEFLGDAVLELISSDLLFCRFPSKQEGELSKLRASLVCEPSLAFSARELNIGRFLLLGKGEEATGGRDRDSILSDALEAIIESIYLDGGFDPAKAFVLQYVLNDIEHKRRFHDCKTVLQEVVQSHGKASLKYELSDTIGPEHNRTFVMQVCLDGKVIGTGEGRTKQAAGQKAAYQALIWLKEQGIYQCKDDDLCI